MFAVSNPLCGVPLHTEDTHNRLNLASKLYGTTLSTVQTTANVTFIP